MIQWFLKEIRGFSRSLNARKADVELLALDGMRGFALLLVLFSHMGLGGIKVFGVIDFSGVGKSGVFLFFILSSYLLTRQILLAGQNKVVSFEYWRKYLIKRVLRIYPLYTLTLIIFLVLGTLEVLKFDIYDVVGHLLLQEGIRHFWAIPVEFKYYFALPFVAFVMSFLFRYSYFAWVFVVVSALCIGQPSDVAVNSIHLLDYLHVFLLGSAIAGMDVHLKNTRYAHRRKIVGLLGMLAYLALAVLLVTVPSIWSWLSDQVVEYDFLHKESLMYGLLWGSVLLYAVQGKSVCSELFSLSVLRFFGAISFSVYLLHPLLLRPFIWMNDMADIWKTMGFLLVSALVGTCSYLLVEKKFLKMAPK